MYHTFLLNYCMHNVQDKHTRCQCKRIVAGMIQTKYSMSNKGFLGLRRDKLKNYNESLFIPAYCIEFHSNIEQVYHTSIFHFDKIDPNLLYTSN